MAQKDIHIARQRNTQASVFYLESTQHIQATPMRNSHGYTTNCFFWYFLFQVVFYMHKHRQQHVLKPANSCLKLQICKGFPAPHLSFPGDFPRHLSPSQTSCFTQSKPHRNHGTRPDLTASQRVLPVVRIFGYTRKTLKMSRLKQEKKKPPNANCDRQNFRISRSRFSRSMRQIDFGLIHGIQSQKNMQEARQIFVLFCFFPWSG